MNSDIVSALAFKRGSLRLVVLRTLALVGFCVPGVMLVENAARGVLGEDPRALELKGALPFHIVQELLSTMMGAPIAVLAVGVLAFFVCDQVLTAGVLTLLDPHRRDAHPRVWRMLFDEANEHFWPLMRIALVTLIFFGIFSFVLGLVGDAIAVRADREGWSADARYVVVTQWRVGLTAIAFAKLGALAFWCKVLTVADGRRRVRRTLLDAIKVQWRAPLRAMGVFVVVTLSVQALGAAILTSVVTRGGGSLSMFAFVFVIVVHMAVWHALAHYGRIIYGGDRFDDIRGRGDEPLGVWAWVKRKVQR